MKIKSCDEKNALSTFCYRLKGKKKDREYLILAANLSTDQPVGVARFRCVGVAVSCTRKMCVLWSVSRVRRAGGFFLRHMRLHGFLMFGLVGQHITHNVTQPLGLAHIIRYLHGCVFLLLLPFRLHGSANDKILDIMLDLEKAFGLSYFNSDWVSKCIQM